MEAGFRIGEIEIEKALRMLFIPFLVEDLQSKCLEKDAIAALIDEVHFVECAEHIRQGCLDLDGGNRGNDVEVVNRAVRSVEGGWAIHAFPQILKVWKVAVWIGQVQREVAYLAVIALLILALVIPQIFAAPALEDVKAIRAVINSEHIGVRRFFLAHGRLHLTRKYLLDFLDRKS